MNRFTAIILDIIVQFLDYRELSAASLVNHAWNDAVNRRIWRKPSFHDGYMRSPIDLLILFLSILPQLRPEVKGLITQLDFTEIEESTYTTVPPDFFATLVLHVPNLQNLKFNKTSFFTSESLHHVPKGWKMPNLRALDLSYCENITGSFLRSLAPGVPALQQIRLDSIDNLSNVEQGLLAFADYCTDLCAVSVRNNSSVTDTTLAALAKFGKIRIKEIDLAGCVNASDAGIATMARYNINLQYLNVSLTGCSANTAALFLETRSARYMRHLDISHCAAIDKQPDRIAESLFHTSAAPGLKSLSVSMAVADATVKRYLGVSSLCPLEFLVIHDVPEHTPFLFLTMLMDIFPTLTSITLIRDYYETDFMAFDIDMKKTRHKNGDETITEETIAAFNRKQQKVLIVLTNKRDKIEGLSMHFW